MGWGKGGGVLKNNLIFVYRYSYHLFATVYNYMRFFLILYSHSFDMGNFNSL